MNNSDTGFALLAAAVVLMVGGAVWMALAAAALILIGAEIIEDWGDR